MSRERKITILEPTLVPHAATKDPVLRKMRVAAYARVSTEQDEQQNSYSAQVEYYTSYIKSNPNWIFVDVFADRGITGTSTKNRESFNQMVEMALNGEIDLILTKSISRFARNTVDTLQVVRQLKAIGVEVIFEKENLHTLDPKCEMILTIMSSLAQEESRSISENVRWGIQKSMRDGNVHIAYSRFIGYRKGVDGLPEIVEEEAKIIRKIFDLYLSGETTHTIAVYLTEQGIPTPGGKQKWSPSTVRSILGNEKYKGDALLQKTYTVDYLTKEIRKNRGEVPSVLVRNSHEPIIDPEVFDRVQELLIRRRTEKKLYHSKHPFAGKIICADCGSFYGHKVCRGCLGERYDVWFCNHKYDGETKCESPRLRETEIQGAFESLLRKLGYDDCAYTGDRWRETVKTVDATKERILKFTLISGKKIKIKV